MTPLFRNQDFSSFELSESEHKDNNKIYIFHEIT